MHTTVQTQFTIITSFIIGLVAVMFGLSVFVENEQQMAASSAVEIAMMASRDDDSRVVRGVFAINKAKFETNIRHANLHWHNKKKGDTVKCLFLRDKSKNAKQFDRLNHNPDCIPIKAVKVLLLRKLSNGKYKTVDAATYMVSAKMMLSKHNNDISADGTTNDQLPQNVKQ